MKKHLNYECNPEKAESIPNRSDSYQWMLIEVVCKDTTLASFTNEQSLQFRLNPFMYDEKVLDLKDQLRKRFWELAKEHLTDKQFTIVRLLCDGYTQWEVADMTGVNQSSITKSINGNNDRNGKVYGGFIKKMKKIIDTDEAMQALWRQIAEAEELRW